MIKDNSGQTSLALQPSGKAEVNEKLTQRAYLNIIAAIMVFLVQGGTSLLINPFLVGGLGRTYYGILQILQRLNTLMIAADGRPMQALKWAIANQQATTDPTTKKQAIGSAVGIWLIFTPVLLTVGGILVWLSPFVTKVPASQSLMVRLTTALYVLDILLIGIATLPDAVLRGMNLSYKRMMLTPSLVVVNGTLTAGAILLGFGLPGIAAASVVTTIITGLLWWGIIRRLLPWFGVARPTIKALRRFIAFSGWFFCWTLINKVILNGDIVVLGLISGPVIVSTFSLTSYVARMVTELSALVSGSITPGLGTFISKERYAEAGTVRHEMLITNWLLCVSIGVSILLWNQSFIGLWVGREFYAGTLANLMIVLTVFQLTFIRNDAFIIDLTLNLRRKVLLGGLSTLIALALAAILVPRLSIVGLCLGLIMGRSILSIGYPLLIGSALKFRPQISLKNLLQPVMTTAVLLGSSAYAGQFLLVKSWLQFFVFANLSFISTFGAAFLMGLTIGERKAIVARICKVSLLGRA